MRHLADQLTEVLREAQVSDTIGLRNVAAGWLFDRGYHLTQFVPDGQIIKVSVFPRALPMDFSITLEEVV